MEIKNCPFCGSKAKVETECLFTNHGYTYETYRSVVNCTNFKCGVLITFIDQDKKKAKREALNKWNRRF